MLSLSHLLLFNLATGAVGGVVTGVTASSAVITPVSAAADAISTRAVRAHNVGVSVAKCRCC